MDRRDVLRKLGLALAVLLVLMVLFSAVRVLDPLWSPPEPIETDADDPPERQVYAALENTERANFAVTVSRSFSNPSAHMFPPGPFRYIVYDNRDREALTRYPQGDDDGGYYANPYGKWNEDPDLVDPVTHVGQPPDRFFEERRVLTCECVETAVANETTLIATVRETRPATALYLGANASANGSVNATLRIVVDRQRGVLRRSTFRLHWPNETGNGTTNTYVQRFEKWGEAEVQRPDWAQYHHMEFVLDVWNAERRRWVGEESWDDEVAVKLF